jgi:hypothetical protein
MERGGEEADVCEETMSTRPHSHIDIFDNATCGNVIGIKKRTEYHRKTQG